jgi:hypothetical protein
MNIFFWKIKNKNITTKQAINNQFEVVRPVLESLREYDEGTKQISTTKIRGRFERIQETTR